MSTPYNPPHCTKCNTPMTSPVNAMRASLEYSVCIDCANQEPPIKVRASIHVDHEGNPQVVLPGERNTLPEIKAS